MGCWIPPEKIARSWKRRNDVDIDERAYHRAVVHIGVGILKERRENGEWPYQ